MTNTIIVRATGRDLDGIVALQAANQPGQGGTLSACLPASRITTMMQDMPLIVARRDHKIAGYLMTSSRAMNADIPVIRAMLDIYPGTEDAYVYGPICVDISERGKGLAQAMYTGLRNLLPSREGILFIRRDNTASLRAHEKMGMREVAEFEYGGNKLAVFSCTG